MYGSYSKIACAILVTASLLNSSRAFANFITKGFVVPGATETYFWGINDQGDIVGDFGIPNANGSGSTNHGLLITDGNWSIVDVPNMTDDRLTDINNSRQYVGSGRGSNVEDGFFFNGSSYEAINYPGAIRTRVWGLNDSGQMVGEFSITLGSGGGFLYSNGNYTQITIPNSNYVVPYGINNSGEISGLMRDSSNKYHGFVYDGIQAVLFDVIGSPLTAIYGLNDIGSFAGGIDNSVGSLRRSFARVGGIDEVLVGYYSEARGINNLNEVVGWKSINGGSVAYLACPTVDGVPTTCAHVPDGVSISEPAPLALMILSISGLGCAAARRGAHRRQCRDGTFAFSASLSRSRPAQ